MVTNIIFMFKLHHIWSWDLLQLASMSLRPASIILWALPYLPVQQNIPGS